MKILRTVQEAAEYGRHASASIGFVPTMGALHEGHLALLRKAKTENEVAGVSIFVNPLQFNNATDFTNYPIDTDNDIRLLEAAGADFLFLPNKEELLNGYQPIPFDLGEINSVMEGPFRPGHFQGVANIVHLLFSIIHPTKAYFGEKDFQQLAVVRRMCETENLGIEIVGYPTVREENGLALSSRNRRLSPDNIEKAAQISRFICSLREQYSDHTSSETIRHDLYRLMEKMDFRPDYFEICDHYTLELLSTFSQDRYLNACVAYHAGDVRLIDNHPYPLVHPK